MLNSLKQLIRTPVKTVLFLLLMAAATALLVLGANLWADTQQKIDRVEESFTTIGTVEQKPSGTREVSYWDFMSKDTVSYTADVYDPALSVDILDFEGANYLAGPEKRPFYFGYNSALKLPDSINSLEIYTFIIEFTPDEDCVPTEPVHVTAERVLYGNLSGREDFWFCNHSAENPMPLEAGKHYIAMMWEFYTSYSHPDFDSRVGAEMTPIGIPQSVQSVDGVRVPLEDELDGNTQLEEVTDGFYDTAHGKYWLELAKACERLDGAYCVLPASNMNLLPSFHEQDVIIRDGREITKEEFASGAEVCLVSTTFAFTNNLQVGDKIPVEPAEADYSEVIGDKFSAYQTTRNPMLNAEGKPFEPFWSAEYEIVGLYYTVDTQIMPGMSEIGNEYANTIVVPANSIRASDENNVLYCGGYAGSNPGNFASLRAYNTSFQIPNGTTAEFMEAFYAAVPEADQLEITFYDNGYEQVIGGLNNMRSISILLFAAGLVAALAILILLLYFFIVRQKKRTAVERSLGMSRRQCRVSLASGVVMLSIVAAVLGTVGSTFLIDKVDELDLTGQAEETYSRYYSIWVTPEVELPEDVEAESADALWLDFAIPAGMVLLTAALSALMVNQNLKTEPILLLSTKAE